MADETGGIFDDVGGEGTPPPPPAPEGGAPTPDEGGAPGEEGATPDVATRPDYIPEKFWDADSGQIDTEKLATSYSELEKAYGKKNPDAPESYDLDLPEGFELPESAVQILKDNKIQNDAAKAIVGELQSVVAAEVGKLQLEVLGMQVRSMKGIDMDSQGDAAYQEYVKELYEFAVDKYGEEEAKYRASSIAGIKDLDTLMNAGKGDRIPQGAGSSQVGGYTHKDLQEVFDDPNYHLDNAQGVALRNKALEISRALNKMK
jgi:hypothetical protein